MITRLRFLLLLIAVPFAPWVSAQDSGESQADRVRGGALEEIVVTARKRGENLQKAPVAITAIPEGELVSRGVLDIRAAQNLVPSVRFQQQNAATEIYIRGVGSTLDFPQVDPPTAFHFNGIYIPREGTSVPIYDVSQLEVLPGPQGTLYGRGVLGGIVDVKFNRPDDEQATSLLVEVGNYDSIHTTITHNQPITDNFAIRGAIDYMNRDGYLESGADSQDDWAARLSMQWDPTDRLSIYAWGSIVEKDGNPPNLVAFGVEADGTLNPGSFIRSDPYNDLLPAEVLATSPFGQVNKRDQEYDNYQVGAEINYQFSDSISVTYIPSYLDFMVDVEYWLSGLPAVKIDEFSQASHELRVNGEEEWGNWLVGLYYYSMESEGEFYVSAFDSSGFPVSLVDSNEVDGIALFAQATYSLTDTLRLTAGFRASEDDREGDGRFFDGVGLSPYDADLSYDNVDFKLGLDYDLSDSVMLYTAIQSGFQPGTYNTFASTPEVSNEVEEATLLAYSVGFKGRFFDDSLQLNTEVYYYDYQDLFASAFDTVLGTTRTFNAEKVEIYGVQLDAIWSASENGQFNLNVGYLHARNEDFTLPDGTANFDGLQLQYAPDWTVNLGYQHDFDLNNGYLRLMADTRFEDNFFADFRHTPGGEQDSYFKSNASATYYTYDGKWSLGVYIKNIEDEPVIAATAAGSNFPFNPQGATSYLEAPRIYGARFTINF